MSTRNSRNKDLFQAVAFWVIAIALWEAAFRIVAWRPWIFPAPSHVLDSVFALLGQKFAFGGALKAGWPFPETAASSESIVASRLVEAVLTSCGRLVLGFAVSGAVGLVLGVAMWRYRLVDSALGPVFLGLQTLPSVCWVPIAILTLGINEAGLIFVLVMGSVFAIAILIRDGLRSTPPIYRSVGHVFGARGLSFYSHVMLPASLPVLASGLRSGFSFAWRSLMGGELIFVLSRHGLGHLLSTGREFGDVAQVIAVMTFMVAIGMTVDKVVFAAIESGVSRRFGLEAAGAE